jgi:MAternally-affected-uncoordination protein
MGSVAPDEAQETADALMFMADEFVRDDCPLQAVKCYEAICDKNNLTILPLPEARARLALARLLLEHTDNVHRAKTHLETTQMLLRSVHGHESLKCRTFSGLLKCYRLMGPDLRRQQTDATQKGLDLSRVAAKKCPAREREAWRAWQFHFLLEKADLKMAQGDFRLARKTLAEGAAAADDAGDALAACAFALAQLQRAIAQRIAGAGAGSGERAALDAADKAVGALEAQEGAEKCAAVKLHHRVLRLLARLAAGNVGAAAGDPAEIKALLQQTATENAVRDRARGKENGPGRGVKRKGERSAKDEEILASDEYFWLPSPATRALARLLCAEAARPTGQFKDARLELEAVVAECDEALIELGVLPEGGDARAAREAEERAPASGKKKGGGASRQWVCSEADLAPRVASDATPYLTLRMLALQSLVGVDLTSTKIDEAAARAEKMRATVEAYPRALRRCAAAADMAEGQVLHSVGQEAEAAVRFAAAAETAEAFGAPATRDLACVCGALSELADGSPEAVSRALNLVRPVTRRHEDAAAAASAAADEAAAPNYAYQAAALFVSGYAALRQGGASQEAKPKLSRALKLAHSQCCNHQLVAQSLSLIGTVVLDTRGGDLGQSLDMLQSSFTLSKAQEDMPAQLGCLGGLLRLHRLRGSPEEEQSALTSYRRRKLSAYDALVAAAAEDEARLVRIAAGGLIEPLPATDVVAMDADDVAT